MRILGTDILVNAVRDYIWSKKDSDLVDLGIKLVDEGEFQVPAVDQLSTRLPQVVIKYRSAQTERDKPRRAVHAIHTIEIHLIRLLGDTEAKDVLIRKGCEALWNLFAQGTFELPGYVPSSSTNILIEDAAPGGFEIQDGFLLDDLAELEHGTIPLSISAMHYDA